MIELARQLKWISAATALALTLSSCVTHPPKEAETTAPPAINLNHLAEQLHLTSHDLGLTEKPFNACEYGLRDRFPNCPQLVMTSINYRIRCRDTVDTTETTVTAVHLDPLVTERMDWQLGDSRGETHTDSSGHGRVLALSNRSLKKKMLIFHQRTKLMGLRAYQVSQIVVPRDWCED